MPTPRKTVPASQPPPALPPEPLLVPPADRAQPPPRARQPGSITASAVLLFIFGTLSALMSAGVLLWSLMAMRRFGGGLDGFGGGFAGDPMRGFDPGPSWWTGPALFGILLFVGVAVSGGHIAAGWAILHRQVWGRILGMVVSGVAIVVLVLGVGSTLIWVGFMPDFSDFDRGNSWWEWFRSVMTASVAFGTIVSIAVGAAYTYILVALARHEEAFD